MIATSLYHELILDLNRNPLNKTPLSIFDAHHKESNPTCGDMVEIFIKLGKDGKVEQVGWQGDGCAISQASTSLLTDYIKNKTKTEIEKITKEELLAMLGLENLNPTRLRCALLSLKTLENALL